MLKNSSFAATSETGMSWIPSFLPPGRIHEKVAEIAGTLCALELLSNVVNILYLVSRIRQVQNESGVAAVLVILPAKQRG